MSIYHSKDRVFMANRTMLIRYNIPIQIAPFDHSTKYVGYNGDWAYMTEEDLEEKQREILKFPCREEGSADPDTQEILTAIFPPIEFVDPNGQWWRQTVCNSPATRVDAIELSANLDQALNNLDWAGISPDRMKVFGQAFDEIIRQVTINCTERGVLLLRVRREAALLYKEYRKLYESSVAFGFRQILLGEKRKDEMKAKIEDTLSEVNELQAELEEAIKRMEFEEKTQEQTLAQDKQKYTEELNAVARENESLKIQTETLIGQKKVEVQEKPAPREILADL